MTYCDDGQYVEIEHKDWSSEWVRIAYRRFLEKLGSCWLDWCEYDYVNRVRDAELCVRKAAYLFRSLRIPPNSKEFEVIWLSLPSEDALNEFKEKVRLYEG